MDWDHKTNTNEWARWIPWAEFFYNTSIHATTRNSPIEIVYGHPPPTLLSYAPGTTQVEAVDKALKEGDQVIVDLKGRLQESQSRMKKCMIQIEKIWNLQLGIGFIWG